MGMAIRCRDYDEQQAKNKPQKLACHRLRIFAYLPVRKIRSSKTTCPNGFKNLSHILTPYMDHMIYATIDTTIQREISPRMDLAPRNSFSDFAALAFRGMILSIKE